MMNWDESGDAGGFPPSVSRVRQGEVEGRALARRRLRPDAPTMPAHHTLDNRQADAGAGKFTLTVQALKCTEQLVGIGRIEAGAIVAHEERARSIDDGSAEFH